MHLSVQSYRGSVRAHIDFGSYSKTHTDSWARTQLPPPRGVALINELKVQRCFVCERYMKVISPPLFCSREGNYREERLWSIWFLPLYSLVRCASYLCAEGDAFQLSPSLVSIYDLQKELFKETKSIKIPHSPFRPRYIGVSIWLKWRCQLQCHFSTRVYKVPVIGSQGHMARFKIYPPYIGLLGVRGRVWSQP